LTVKNLYASIVENIKKLEEKMELKKELYKIEDELKKEIEGVSDYIFKNQKYK
jgi:hypothetical protein